MDKYILYADSKNGIEKAWTLYKGEKMIKDTFNLNVVKAILGRAFNRIYKNRIIRRF